MTKRPNLTPEQVERIVELRTVKRLGVEQIAREIGCSKGSVDWALLREGADIPGAKHQIREIPDEPVVRIRDGRPVRLYTKADDQLLLKLEAEGLNPAQIGRRFTPARQPNSVTGRLRTLARREDRLEAAAQ
jgi:transposase-like protein